MNSLTIAATLAATAPILDWSATAAWIALIVSIVGTVLGPLITTILTNRHQIKLRKLDLSEKQKEELCKSRTFAIENFISNVGKCLSTPDYECVMDCGEHFFQVYAYVPQSLWESLDTLYVEINERKWDSARSHFNSIAKHLVLLLKEPH